MHAWWPAQRATGHAHTAVRPKRLFVAHEQRIDISKGAHEREERLKHRFVLMLHLLISLVGQLDLCFRGPVQLKPTFGSNQLPVEEAIKKRHL